MAFRGHVGLVGREPECALLDQTVAAVRAGESRVLVLHGPPGIGKSALLEYLAGSAAGVPVLRAVGAEAEMELPFATLHQLCAPLLDRLADIPDLHRDSLSTVFGMRAGDPPERFLIGLGVLGLLAEASRNSPVLCLVDDAQWMDRASAQVLGFVARRLPVEPVALVFATRGRAQDLLGLPVLEVTGLGNAEAHALLDSATYTRLDQHIRDRLVAEARGNPRALLELPHQLTVTELAGGFGLLKADTVPSRIEQEFLARVEQLPGQSRLLLLIAAAEPVGDPTLVWRAAELLGVSPATALEGDASRLLSLDVRVIFRHPLVRSAVYRAAQEDDRRAVHLALAEVTDRQADPDRRAWHLASATAGPDETVAAELERSAGRAQTRGGLAAAAAFLQRSVALTIDTSRRAERAVAAADASARAGDLAAARRLVDIAELDAHNEFLRVRADLVRARITCASGFGGKAPAMLLAAARRLEAFDMDLARETYLLAWGAAVRGAADDECLMTISQAIRDLPAPQRGSRPIDLVLEGCSQLVTEGWGAAVTTLRAAMAALEHLPAPDVLKWGWAACGVSAAVWDEQIMCETSARAVEVVSTAGVLAELPVYLDLLGSATSLTGDLATAAGMVEESGAVATATGVHIASYTALILKAMQGKEADVSELIAAANGSPGTADAATAHWAASVLYNGLARYEEALSAAQAGTRTAQLIMSVRIQPELIEAAVRVENEDIARGALERLTDSAHAYDTNWAQGTLARCRALLSGEAAAEDLYREAVERLSRTRLRPELARAHLLYGEWLRRQSRRVDARQELRTAHDMFDSIGMAAFAGRARRELLASGEKLQKRGSERSSGDELTPQEKQIALLVRDGLSNSEVGARLYLSPRTVEWHLRNIFTKLSITSRRQLRDALLRTM